MSSNLFRQRKLDLAIKERSQTIRIRQLFRIITKRFNRNMSMVSSLNCLIIRDLRVKTYWMNNWLKKAVILIVMAITQTLIQSQFRIIATGFHRRILRPELSRKIIKRKIQAQQLARVNPARTFCLNILVNQ